MPRPRRSAVETRVRARRASTALRQPRQAATPAVRGEHPVGDRAVREGERRPDAGVGVGLGRPSGPSRSPQRLPPAGRDLRRGGAAPPGSSIDAVDHAVCVTRRRWRAGARWRTTRGRRPSALGTPYARPSASAGSSSATAYVSLATVHCCIGTSHTCSAHSPWAFTSNGSVRGGTSHSVTCSSGCPARANAAQYQPGPPVRRRYPVTSPRSSRGDHPAKHPLLDGCAGVRQVVGVGEPRR